MMAEIDQIRERADRIAAFSPNQAERDRAALLDMLDSALNLMRDLTDPDDCTFDHHGGCQAHGYLDLAPGEKCPQREAKDMIVELQGRHQVIPAEAVEAAYAHLGPDDTGFRYVNKARIRGLLEAAAPHMLAAAWDEGDEAWDSNRIAIGTNPFRREA